MELTIVEVSGSVVEEVDNSTSSAQHYTNSLMEEEVDTFSPVSFVLPITQYNYDISYTQAYIETMIWYLNLMRRRR